MASVHARTAALPAATLLPGGGTPPPAPRVPTIPLPPASKAPAAPPVPSAPAAPAVPGRPKRQLEVWGWDAATGRDVLLQHSGSKVSSVRIAAEAYANAERTLDYLRSTFHRNGVDGTGGLVRVLVHATDPLTGKAPLNNAFWMDDEQRAWFGDGDGKLWSPLGSAADVVAHELVHGVTYASVNLDTTYGQEGALHESFSDVIATGIDGNWTIGEDAYTPGTPGDALRDLTRPKYARMGDVKPWETDAHDLSSIPSFAAYKVAQRIGGDAMRQIWYAALTSDLPDHVGFAGARRATLAAAERLYGRDSDACRAVGEAWDAVGVDDRTVADSASRGVRASLKLMGTAAAIGAIR